MTDPAVIDIHAHVFTEEMIRQLQAEAPSIGLRLFDHNDEGATLEVAGVHQNPFPRAAWDFEKRFADMAVYGADMQVLANIPHTFLYDEEPALTEACALVLNDGIAAVVRRWPEKFLGLATVPLQDPDRAARELHRAMQNLGLRGAHIGSHVGGRNLDDPALEPFWAAADELGAFVMVHPHKVAAGGRLGSYYLKNVIGNPLEPTIAGASLIFGGVVDRFPGIRFCLVHGGGFVPYQAGRFRHGWEVRPEARRHLPDGPEPALARVYYDTILHSQEALGFLVGSAGASRVLLGSDYPFDMQSFEGVRQVRALDIPDEAKAAILGGGPLLADPRGAAEAAQ